MSEDALPSTAVFLLGFMGSGKSAVARHLSRELNLPRIDLDTRIEEKLGMTIADFFSAHGETAFREVETATLRETQGEDAVFSLGGGVPTVEANRRLLRNAAEAGALVVYLQADSSTLAARIRRQPGKRPLIDGDGLLDLTATQLRVEELLFQREALYLDCANYVVNTVDKDIPAVSREIACHWRRHRGTKTSLPE